MAAHTPKIKIWNAEPGDALDGSNTMITVNGQEWPITSIEFRLASPDSQAEVTITTVADFEADLDVVATRIVKDPA